MAIVVKWKVSKGVRRGYVYEQHSKRINGKVVTNKSTGSRYLGPLDGQAGHSAVSQALNAGEKVRGLGNAFKQEGLSAVEQGMKSSKNIIQASQLDPRWHNEEDLGDSAPIELDKLVTKSAYWKLRPGQTIHAALDGRGKGRVAKVLGFLKEGSVDSGRYVVFKFKDSKKVGYCDVSNSVQIK